MGFELLSPLQDRAGLLNMVGIATSIRQLLMKWSQMMVSFRRVVDLVHSLGSVLSLTIADEAPSSALNQICFLSSFVACGYVWLAMPSPILPSAGQLICAGQSGSQALVRNS
jgi:hypothetical protein